MIDIIQAVLWIRPDPAFHFDVDPDLDPTFHIDADPDPVPFN